MIDVSGVIPTGDLVTPKRKRMKRKKGMEVMIFHSPIVSFDNIKVKQFKKKRSK